jgi:hypothetical protein
MLCRPLILRPSPATLRPILEIGVSPNILSATNVNSIPMAKKPIMLVALLAVIGGIFLYINKDWFKRRPIQISHRLYRFGSRFGGEGSPAPVMFEFDRRLKLTSLKVVAVWEAATNKFPHAFWQLTSDSNAVPTKGVVYGLDVPGMRPVMKGLTADALDPNQTYRLFVEAGSLKAQHDFTLDSTEPQAAQ